MRDRQVASFETSLYFTFLFFSNSIQWFFSEFTSLKHNYSVKPDVFRTADRPNQTTEKKNEQHTNLLSQPNCSQVRIVQKSISLKSLRCALVCLVVRAFEQGYFVYCFKRARSFLMRFFSASNATFLSSNVMPDYHPIQETGACIENLSLYQ